MGFNFDTGYKKIQVHEKPYHRLKGSDTADWLLCLLREDQRENSLRKASTKMNGLSLKITIKELHSNITDWDWQRPFFAKAEEKMAWGRPEMLMVSMEMTIKARTDKINVTMSQEKTKRLKSLRRKNDA